jgi:hypothetical protein
MQIIFTFSQKTWPKIGVNGACNGIGKGDCWRKQRCMAIKALNKRLEEAFHGALELSGAKERAAYLNRNCSGDEMLQTEVEALIRFYEQAGVFLEVPALELDAASDPEPRIAKPLK